jgi:hypothetical protein
MSPIAAQAATLGGLGFGSTAAAPSMTGSGESIGFAELLFQGGSDSGPREDIWGQGASEAFASGEVGGWNPEDDTDTSPWWLKSIVFIAGSMVAGAVLAQISGHAVWQPKPGPKIETRAAQ